MKVVDPRLGTYARAIRVGLAVSVGVGAVTALLVVAQAALLATAISGAFAHGEDLERLRVPVLLLLAVVIARAAVAWGAEVAAGRTAARAKSQLRSALLERAVTTGDAAAGPGRTGDLLTLATRGIDALDAYFGRYLPQLVLAVVVPVIVLAAVLGADWVAAVLIALTLPLIPVFTALIGSAVGERSGRQLRLLQQLAGHFLDLVAGLPTLKVFGRAAAQARLIREVTDRYRRATLATLRLAFVSSLVLELVATISVALVAVAIGLRLQDGRLSLFTGLFVLVLAPEAYLPLRTLATSFHASAEGVRAAGQVLDVLEAPVPRPGTRRIVPDPAVTGLVVGGLCVTYPGRATPALDDLSLRLQAGEVLAITGPSGSGKSTLLSVLLGLVQAQAGRIRVDGVDLAELDPDAWRAQLAWVPQRPHLFAGSIADNVRLGRPGASVDDVERALADAGLGERVRSLRHGSATMLGERGAGLSAGERQRVALARAFVRDSRLLLLDEPTAGLDGRTEQEVARSIRARCEGRSALLVSHRPALLVVADRVLTLAAAEVAA